MNRRACLQATAAAASAWLLPRALAQDTPAVLVGGPAPVLKGRGLDGKAFDLSQLKGKAVLVAYWATWCPTCRVEMPEFRSFYEAQRTRGFELVTVSIDSRLDDVLGYQKLVTQTLPGARPLTGLWRKDPELRDEFGRIRSTPTAFLVSRQGRVAAEFHGRLMPAQWQQVEAEIRKA